MKWRCQRRVQPDSAIEASRQRSLECFGLGAIYRRSNHHDGCCVDALMLDEIADRAIDAGSHSVVVSAKPDMPRRCRAHSAAVRDDMFPAGLDSVILTLCSETK